MKYFVYFLTIIILLGLNAGLFSYFKIFSAAPNLLLILIVIFSLDRGNDDFLFLAFFSGIFLDVFSGAFFGSFTLALLLAGILLRFLIKHVLMLEINWKLLAISLGGVVLLTASLVRIISQATYRVGWSGLEISFEGFWLKTLAEFGYSLLLLYPMLYLGKLIRHINEDLLVKQRKQ